MKFRVSLEGVVQSHQEGTVSDGLQDLPLGLCMLGRFFLLHDGSLLQDFHGVKLASVGARPLSHQEDLAVSCRKQNRSDRYKNDVNVNATRVTKY